MPDHRSEITPDTDKTCALCGVTLPKGQEAIRELNYSAEPWESWRCVDERGCKARQEVLKDEPEQLREHIKELTRTLQHEKDRYCALMTDFNAMRHDRDVLGRQLNELLRDHAEVCQRMTEASEQLDATRGAQTAIATEVQEALERKRRARLVREIEFVRGMRAIALRLKSDRPGCPVSNMMLSEADAQMIAIEQDQAPEEGISFVYGVGESISPEALAGLRDIIDKNTARLKQQVTGASQALAKMTELNLPSAAGRSRLKLLSRLVAERDEARAELKQLRAERSELNSLSAEDLEWIALLKAKAPADLRGRSVGLIVERLVTDRQEDKAELKRLRAERGELERQLHDLQQAKQPVMASMKDIDAKLQPLADDLKRVEQERDELRNRFKLARHEVGELRHELGRLKSQEKGNAWPLVYTGGEYDPEATATVLVRALEGRLEQIDTVLNSLGQPPYTSVGAQLAAIKAIVKNDAPEPSSAAAVDHEPIKTRPDGTGYHDEIIVMPVVCHKDLCVEIREVSPDGRFADRAKINLTPDMARHLIYRLDRGIRAIEGESECAEPLCCSYMHDLVAKANAERDVTWRELDRARAQRDALKQALEQIGEVATATYTKFGATAAQRLELINKIIADAGEAAIEAEAARKEAKHQAWVKRHRADEAEARRFEREHTDCDDPECPRHGASEDE